MADAHPVLVTGATGFIGMHLVRRLIDQGRQVRTLGRNPTACRQLQDLGCEVVRADLREPDAVLNACEGCELVCHAGALSSPWGRKRDFWEHNVQGTRNVLNACQRHAIRRCVYVSSPSVISDARDLVDVREDAPFPKRAISLYSHSKRMAEELVLEAGELGLETVILRPKAVFGEGDNALVPRLLRAARLNRLRQIGDGKNLVDLTYVGNVVDAILLATESERFGRIYHVTNGEHVPIWELIRHLCRELGYNDRFGSVPVPVAWAAASGMEWRARIFGGEPLMTRYSVSILSTTQTYDIGAAQRDLGYSPRVSIAEAVEETLVSLRRSEDISGR